MIHHTCHPRAIGHKQFGAEPRPLTIALPFTFDGDYRERSEELMAILGKSGIEQHGWQISVGSEPGKGSCLSIRLKRAPQEQQVSLNFESNS